MQQQFWNPTDADLESGESLSWEMPIHIRAVSLTEPPDAKAMYPLDNDAYRLSFWVAVSEAVHGSDERSKKVLALLRSAATCVKVTFLLCTSDEHAEKRKWRLAQKDQTAAENATLRGWKRLLGVASVAQQLKVWSPADATADGVSKWFAAEKVQFSTKVVRQILLVHSRMTAIDVEPIMEELESASGVDHILSKLSILDGICQMTKMDNALLQNALLTWICQDLKGAILSKQLAADSNRETVLQHARAALLGRRIVWYLCSKLKLPAPTATPEDPTELRKHSFLQLFTSHDKFVQSGLGTSTGDLTWCATLFSFQQEAIAVLKQFLMPVSLIRETLVQCVVQDPLLSAEVALQQPAWVEIVNLPKMLEARREELIRAGILQAENSIPSGPAAAEVAATAQAESDQNGPSASEPIAVTDEQAEAVACLAAKICPRTLLLEFAKLDI